MSDPVYLPLGGSVAGRPEAPEGAAGSRPDLSGGASSLTPEGSFVSVLKDSIKKVNAIQVEADKTIQDYSTGKSNVTLHQTMVEMAQADVSFHLMMQVRDKIVRAYQEMMNMPM